MPQGIVFASLCSILLENAIVHMIVTTKSFKFIHCEFVILMPSSLNKISHPWYIHNQCDGFQETNINPTPISDKSG